MSVIEATINYDITTTLEWKNHYICDFNENYAKNIDSKAKMKM